MNNVVGKMLVVMQLVFSILFMCFAGAVFTFQGQWRDKALAAQSKADDIEQQRKEKAEEAEEAKKIAAEEIGLLKTELDQVKVQLTAVQQQKNEIAGDFEEAQAARDKAIADADAANSEAKARVIEAEALNKEVRSLQVRISELTRQIQDTEDQLLQKSGLVATAVENEERLLTENARLRDLLRINDVDPDQQIAGFVAGQIEKVDGFVKGTIRTNNGQELLQITVGSDDKIFKGMKLTVFRENKYLGQARVVDLSPDTAVCLVDQQTRQGSIQSGDKVTTKL